jgi:tRNA (cmo5U34)-methyltransferase
MTNPEPIAFDQDRASTYDQRFVALAPLRDALHLLIRLILAELPADARILCVGVGTGLELIDLAAKFPHWQFTAVEPAKPMLDRCRQKAEEQGFTCRCTFHEGYLESLPASEPFHAATSLLVSHFLMQPDDRRQFFQQISTRLQPGGYLINADITADMNTPEYQSLLTVWLQMLKYAEVPTIEIEQTLEAFGQSVALLPQQQVESLLFQSGFTLPVQFYQSLLIRGWYAQRSSLHN